jgi:ribose/xylose/arabinose/galactoside ABC-type transport system permease subunit
VIDGKHSQAPGVVARQSPSALAARWRQESALVVLLALILIGALVSGGALLRPGNMVTVLFQAAIVAVLALAQLLVVLTGGIELSVAGTAILTAILMGAISSPAQPFLPYLGVGPAIALGLLVALLIGLFNGLWVAFSRIPPFIVTLATLLLVSGAAYLITGGAPIYEPDQLFERFGQAKLLGLPYPVISWLLLMFAVHLALARTRFGLMLYVVGGNETAARLSGLGVVRLKLLAYSLSGLLAGLGGFLFLARTGYANPSGGGDYLLDSIAAVVVGGVSLNGGRGGVKDVLLGVLILAIVSNLLNIVGVPPTTQSAVKGAIILAAVMLNARLAHSQDA